MGLPAIQRSFVAGILERGGGIRTVVTFPPWNLYCHLCPGERLFLVPDMWVQESHPELWNLYSWIIGTTEIYVAVSIWPERLKRWGTQEAKRYFDEHLLPLIGRSSNWPRGWWQRPSDWML